MILVEQLRQTGTACAEIGRKWEASLSEEDLEKLILAFHRAESLAGYALEDAAAQVPERFRTHIERQRKEEEKHVQIFERFLQAATEPVERPQTKQRPHGVWFVLLLLNELTGYSQFSFLLSLLSPELRPLLEAIMVEEEEHVMRLTAWCKPVFHGKGRKQVERMFERFEQALPGRMEQFFEGEHLEGLRRELQTPVANLLRLTLEELAA